MRRIMRISVLVFTPNVFVRRSATSVVALSHDRGMRSNRNLLARRHLSCVATCMTTESNIQALKTAVPMDRESR